MRIRNKSDTIYLLSAGIVQYLKGHPLVCDLVLFAISSISTIFMKTTLLINSSYYLEGIVSLKINIKNSVHTDKCFCCSYQNILQFGILWDKPFRVRERNHYAFFPLSSFPLYIA